MNHKKKPEEAVSENISRLVNNELLQWRQTE
jgi:hypothetical protein